MHTGETPYHCPRPDCAKKFKWASSLKSHLRFHKSTDNNNSAMESAVRPSLKRPHAPSVSLEFAPGAEMTTAMEPHPQLTGVLAYGEQRDDPRPSGETAPGARAVCIATADPVFNGAVRTPASPVQVEEAVPSVDQALDRSTETTSPTVRIPEQLADESAYEWSAVTENSAPAPPPRKRIKLDPDAVTGTSFEDDMIAAVLNAPMDPPTEKVQPVYSEATSHLLFTPLG